MPTYVALARWTKDGVAKVKESPARLDAFKKLIESAGGTLKAFYLTMGQYDMVVVGEAPSDEVYARVMLELASAGSVQTESLRAFTEEEYRKIISSLP